MIVEKSAFEIASMPQLAKGRGRGHIASSKYRAQYAVAHGQRRGMFGGAHDQIVQIVPLDETHITSETLQDASGEGVYLYIQTTNCRRSLLQMIFRNKPSGASQYFI
jgi:hypothetical protein